MLERFEKAKEFFQNKGFTIEDGTLKTVLATLKENIPLLVVGPTGSGKTLFFQMLAEFLGGDYFYQSLNGSVAIQDLTQERVLNRQGTFEERDMILAKWLRASQKQISLLQLDEINAARAETLLAMHPIMDLKGELDLPYSQEILKANKNSILVMSCNEGDEYAGINMMNMAFQNRFVKIYFRYIQGNKLVNHLVQKTGIVTENAEKVVNTWTKYMSSKQPDQPIIGIRILEYWCRLANHIGLREAGKHTFASLIARDEDELVEIIEGDFFVNLPQ